MLFLGGRPKMTDDAGTVSQKDAQWNKYFSSFSLSWQTGNEQKRKMSGSPQVTFISLSFLFPSSVQRSTKDLLQSFEQLSLGYGQPYFIESIEEHTDQAGDNCCKDWTIALDS